jgi:hypothetical protein
VRDGENQDLRIELEVDDRERKSIDEATANLELGWDASHERPMPRSFANRGLGARNVLVESMRDEGVSASIPVHRG